MSVFQNTFRAFSYRDFRLMWIGACVSTIGTWMQNLAQPWLVYKLTNDPVKLGLDAFFLQVPILLFSLVGGVFADRKSRQSLLLMSQFIQMTCAFTLTALYVAGAVQVWHIWCLSFLTGVAQAFGGPAYSALVPSLVGKEDIGNAVTLNSIQFNLARVLGPALGGVAMEKLGVGWCFGLNGLSFVAVIATLLMIRPKFVPSPSTDSVLKSMKQGIHFIRVRDWMVSLLVIAFLIAVLSFPLITFLPVVAREVLHGSSNTLALLMSLSGIGSILGALITASMKSAGQGKRSLTVMLALGFVVIGFGLSRTIPASVTLVAAMGLCLMVVFSTNLSVVQHKIDDQMRGRVMSVYNVAFRGGMPIGSLVSGLLIKQTSVSTVFIANGALISIAAIYFLLFQRKLLKL